MKTKDFDVLRVQAEQIRKALADVSWMKGTSTREIRVYDNTKIARPLDPECDNAFEVIVELPQGETHVQEAFTVSAIGGKDEYWHWFINCWYYSAGEENDEAIIYEQKEYIKALLTLMPDINITFEDDDAHNYNPNGTYGTEEEGEEFFNIKYNAQGLQDLIG